jgi:hypothetical protein
MKEAMTERQCGFLDGCFPQTRFYRRLPRGGAIEKIGRLNAKRIGQAF